MLLQSIKYIFFIFLSYGIVGSYSLLPQSWKNNIFSYFTSSFLNQNQINIMASTLRPSFSNNVLQFARTALDNVKKTNENELSLEKLSLNNKNLCFYHIKNDGWVPQSEIEIAKKLYQKNGSFLFEENESIGHACCVINPKHTVEQISQFF
jgi:predicted Zn-dependent peptidase